MLSVNIVKIYSTLVPVLADVYRKGMFRSFAKRSPSSNEIFRLSLYYWLLCLLVGFISNKDEE